MCKISKYYVGSIFLSLTIISAICKENNETRYVIATAVLYRNSEGVALLVTGSVSPAADLLITRDLRERLPPPLEVKVVPIYESIYDVPVHKNLWRHLRTAYPPSNLFILTLSPDDSRLVMHNIEKRVYIYNKKMSNKKNRRRDYKPPNNSTPDVLNSSSKQVDAYSYTDNFVPNDIYYAVEKRCANWAPGCESNAGSFLDLPARLSIAKMDYVVPHKLQWLP